MTGLDGAGRAARSGRGGTTGRAAGWPASVRCGRGPPARGAGGALPARAVSLGASDRLASTGACGRGRETAPGRGAAGAPGCIVSTGADGNGCRGPDSTWPGLGPVGSGLTVGGAGRPGANIAAGGPGGRTAGTEGTSAVVTEWLSGGCGAATGGLIGRPASGGRIGAAARISPAAGPLAVGAGASWGRSDGPSAWAWGMGWPNGPPAAVAGPAGRPSAGSTCGTARNSASAPSGT